MRILDNPFKLILPLLFLFTAFSVDAQGLSRTVIKDNGNTGGLMAACDYDGYYVYLTVPTLDDFPCDIHVGVTIEESESQDPSFFQIIPDPTEITIVDPDGPEGPVESHYYYRFRIEALNTSIFSEFCPDGPDSLTFVYNLYCYDGNTYTLMDSEDEEVAAYLGVDQGSDISATWTKAFCCPEAVSGDDPLIPFDNGGDEEEEESDDEGYGYISGGEDQLTMTEGLKESSKQSIFEIRNSNNLIDIRVTNNFIDIKNPLSSNVTFQIVNISGQIVFQGYLQDNSEKQIDISHFTHGLYILTYKNNNSIESKKFVK